MSGVDELVQRLREALEEAERLALRAAGATDRWKAEVDRSLGPAVSLSDSGEGEWSREVNYAVWRCEDEEDGCPERAREWIAEARHIARWDPAAVLRQVAVHRRILERHSGSHMCPEPADPDWIVYEAGERVRKTWPCGDLRDLAEAYGIEPNPSTEEKADG